MNSLQEGLNKIVGDCKIEMNFQDYFTKTFPVESVIELKPCGYHKDRALNTLLILLKKKMKNLDILN